SSARVGLAATYALGGSAEGYPAHGASDGCPVEGVAYCEPGEPMARETRRGQLIGIDIETKLVKTENADLKPYVDYSRLLSISNPDPGSNGSGGGGLTLGMLARLNAGDVKVHAFRLVAEGRYLDGNYLPGYSDTFYEVQQ